MNTLRQAVQEYLGCDATGIQATGAGKGLLDFVTFLEQHHASYITQALALAWAQQPSNAQPAHWAQRLSYVRGFARYRSATDPRTQIPPRVCCPSSRNGHDRICTRTRVRSLLRAALRCRAAMSARAATMGLSLSVRAAERLGPPPRRSAQPRASGCRSQGSGVDDPWRQVRQDSSGPLHASTCKVARRLYRQPQRHWAKRPVSSYLFVSSLGNRLDSGDIHRTFYALSRQIGLRGPSDSHGPRLHDMRHRFATNTLVAVVSSPVKIPSAACRSCPPTLATCTSPIPNGT